MGDTLKHKAGATLITAAQVGGASVFDPAGAKLATIKDVYLDKTTGQAEFVSLAFGGVLGVGEKHHPAPWSALEYDPALKGFRLSLSEAELKSAPRFAADELSGGGDWAGKVRAYYNKLPATMATGEARPSRKDGRHFTHGTSASTADMADDVRHDDKGAHTPHSRQIKPGHPDKKVDQLAEKVGRSESRQEALLDEGVEESFPASDPVSVKHIT